VTWFVKPGDPEEEHYVDAAIGARIVFFTKHKKVASIEKSVR